MSEPSKPCPACNKTENLREVSDGHKTSCCICTVTMPRNLWNRRPIEDTLNARIKTLETQAWNQEADSNKSGMAFVTTINDLTAENERLRLRITRALGAIRCINGLTYQGDILKETAVNAVEQELLEKP